MTKDKTSSLCDCTRCRNLTRFDNQTNSNQNAINHLLTLIKEPDQYIKQIYNEIEKESLNFLKDTDDFSKSSKFQLIIFTKDNFKIFKENPDIKETCFFEEFLETRSDLEGKLNLLFMELLDSKMHQNYLLNCREIVKSIKKQKKIKKEMFEMVCSLDKPLIENNLILQEFVILRKDLNNCKKILENLKQKNFIIIKTMRRNYNQYIIKIIYLWRIIILICENKKLRRMTIQEVLENLRKSIENNNKVNLKKISDFFYDTVQFSLSVLERELLGTIIIFLIENTNVNIKIQQILDLAFIKDDKIKFKSHPLLDLNKEIHINKETILNGLFNLFENQNKHENQNSLIFDNLILKQMKTTLENNFSQSSDISSMSLTFENEKSQSKEINYATNEFQKENKKEFFSGTIFTRKEINKLENLEKIIKNFDGLVMEIMKIENTFYERFHDDNKPIWSFVFKLNKRQLGPLEMLIILKQLNFKKYLIDIGIFVQWYFCLMIYEPHVTDNISSQRRIKTKSNNYEYLQNNHKFKFNNLSKSELKSLEKFSKKIIRKIQKNFLLLKNLKCI